MAIDTSLLVDYSWADIAKAAKAAMMQLTLSKEVVINGRTVVRCSAAEAQSLYNIAVQQQFIEADNSGGMIALVRYGEPNGGSNRGPWCG